MVHKRPCARHAWLLLVHLGVGCEVPKATNLRQSPLLQQCSMLVCLSSARAITLEVCLEPSTCSKCSCFRKEPVDTCRCCQFFSTFQASLVGVTSREYTSTTILCEKGAECVLAMVQAGRPHRPFLRVGESARLTNFHGIILLHGIWVICGSTTKIRAEHVTR